MKLEEVRKSIYSLVSQIKKGQVLTYGQVARKLQIKSPRLIGRVLHQNTSSSIPCHRVVFADGSLSKSYAFGGIKEQKKKLVAEGVPFRKEKVHLVLLKNNTRNLP